MTEEDEEKSMLEFEAQLRAEQARRKVIENRLKLTEEEIKLVRCNTISLQAKVEEEEEYITNNLLKRLDAVRKEKERLAKQVEIEEEFMTNNLQRKLNQLRKEKGELERHLEAEQEYFVNKLQKQLLEITRQKNALERKLNEGRSGLISQFERTVGHCKHSLHPQSCPKERDSVAHLEAQVAAMRDHQQQVERAAHDYRERCEQYAKELEKLTKEKFLLDTQSHMLKEKMERLQQEREAEFAQFELSEERLFNQSIRRHSTDLHSTDFEGPKCLSLSTTPLTSQDSSRSNSQIRPRPRGPSDLLPRSHSDRYTHNQMLRPVDSDPHLKPRSSASSSALTSPGHSTSPTPPPIPSPKPWAHDSGGSSLKRHTEEVLSMSPSVNSPRAPPPSPGH